MPEQQLTSTHIVVNHLRRQEIINYPIETVSHFTYGQKYLSAHIDGQGEVLLNLSLGAVVEQYGDKVVRVHRSVVVFKDRIDSVSKEPDTTNRQMLVRSGDGTVLVPVSRHRMDVVREALAERAT